MGKAIITDLNKGMDLKNSSIDIAPGYTGESIGCDFSVPGVITPMQADALIQQFAPGVPDVIDVHVQYILGVKYQFSTHSDGLRVTSGGVVTLIDSVFTGLFKCLAINDQYIVFSNSALVKKWLPGWTTTDQWGLNTPPAPTLTLSSLTTKVIDACDSLTGWVCTGGTATLDTVNYQSGTGSINLAAAAGATVKLTKAATLDLSKFVTAGDLGTGFISVWFLATDLTAVTSLHLLFDCSATGNFKTDWYQADITINNVATQTLTYAAGGTVPVPSGSVPIPSTASGQVPAATYDATAQQLDVFGIPKSTTKKQDVVQYKAYDFSEAPIEFSQVLVLKKTKRQTTTTSGIWMEFQFQMSEFTRSGANANRDWSTITAIQIEFNCGAKAGSVNVDSLNLLGGGYPFGNYWFATAYENQFGNYGPYSEFAGPVDSVGQQIVLSGLTPDTDPQTTQRRLVVIGGSMTSPMVFFIGDNTTTSYTYNLEDTDLTTIETNFNEDPPQPCTDMILAYNRVWMVSGNSLYYSDADFYEGFPAANFISFPTEILNQIALYQNQYIAVRGNAETLIQVLSSDATTWAITSGAREGSITSSFMINLGGGQHAWIAKSVDNTGAINGYQFWQTADSEYLPQIGWAMGASSPIFGAQASDLVYLYFVDTDGVPRILRIDYRPGSPVAHYVENITPSCIFADPVAKQVFYAIGNQIYQFDAGAGPVPTLLTVPEQFAQNTKIKSFRRMNYDLSGGPIAMQVVRQRILLLLGYGQGGYPLPDAPLDGNPISFPAGMSISQGLILSSSPQGELVVDESGNYAEDELYELAADEGTGFILTLPLKIEYSEEAD